MGGMPYGLQAMLKDGHQHLSGLEEAVLKNIEACKQLAQITRTSMGPNGTRPPRRRRRGARRSAPARPIGAPRARPPGPAAALAAVWRDRRTQLAKWVLRSTRRLAAERAPPAELRRRRARLPLRPTSLNPSLHPPPPSGMNKMVINHLDKLFVTSDASTITAELEVQHPAAKLLALAARSQQEEVGDGANLVLALAGELLGGAEALLRDGLHPVEVADGYAKAGARALEILETLVIPGSDVLDVRDAAAVAQRIKAAVAAKQYGREGALAPLIAAACVAVVPANPANFNVDNVRVVKIPGGGVGDSSVVRGMVLRRGAEGAVSSVTDAKVAVFSQSVDTTATETKGTVLIRSAAELEGYSQSEEKKVEEAIEAVAATGARVVVTGGSFGEMALHFIDKAGLMALKIPSKFDLARFCRATGATALTKLAPPGADQLGFARALAVREIGGTRCAVLEQAEPGAPGGGAGGAGRVATVVVRGATAQLMDDVERAVDDGVNAYRALTRDARALPAGGAPEAEIGRLLAEAARRETGLEQYAIRAFADALEVVPRTIAENAGLDAAAAVRGLAAAHAAGRAGAGLDVETGEPRELAADGLTDLYSAKWWAIRLATEAAATVLRVDQIIMAKAAGGPRPPRGGGGEE